MDPTACLTDLLEASKKTLYSPDSNDTNKEADYLACMVLDLHGWLEMGGFLPYQWAANRPNSRTESEDLLEEVEDIVASRQHDYGDFRVNITRIADMWSAYTGHNITPHDVAQMMVLLKVSRSKVSNLEDNYVDQAGYTEIARALR